MSTNPPEGRPGQPGPQPGPQWGPQGGPHGELPRPSWAQPGQGPGPAPHGAPQQPGGYPGQPGGPFPGGPHPHQGQLPGQPGPYGQPPRPGQPVPGQGFSPAPGGGSGSGGRKTGLLIGAGVLALLLVVGVAVAVLTGRGEGRETAAPVEPQAPSTSTPEQAVQGYLDALAGGRAEEALGYLYERPEDDDLLTDEVLAEAAEIAPITAITVTPPASPDAGEVTATYQVGEEQARYDFTVVGDEDRGFTIISGVVRASMSRVEGLDVLVNGVAPADPTSFSLFPGGYEVTTTQEYFTIEGGERVVTDPRSTESYFDVEPVLDKEGTKLFTTMVTEAADTCLSSNKLKAGCGLDLPEKFDDGTPIVDGTVKRSAPAETRKNLKELKPAPSYDDPTLVTHDGYLGTVNFQARCKDGKKEYDCEALFGAPAFGRPSLDLAAEEPVVEWD
ncbi:hypothetical protein [Auraticoccus monumenti]|uniref:Uncharacterized protein n=1 Tax=Auraticoccus monumenti TaxID=675864 RepID=A0A1G7A737_9ACTN|nr:hypothetical protein [Auraticoccus monumenti]SDE10307.1 hypothetical protein SAMN04489747_2520 [Auraticoccus monumenti]